MWKITLGVEGMACGMCENHINEVIRKKENVRKVSSSKGKKQTVIITEQDLSEERCKELICEAGYDMTSYAKEEYKKKSFLFF